jgi:hypothetical protein
MKTYSVFSAAARFTALLALTLGLAVGLGGNVQAQEGMHDGHKSDSKSQGMDKKELPCGGPSVIKCPKGMSCVDDPSDKCDPTKDGLNCPGKCVAGGGEETKVKQPCGGPSRIKCSGGMVCIDDPSDNCDPTRDGLDCKGMCVAK